MAKQQTQPIIKTTVRLPKALVVKAKHLAVDADCDMNTVIVRALEQYVAKKGERK